MPIYEYTCKQCGNFEIMQRITQMQAQAQQNMRQHIRESLDQTWPPAGGQSGQGRSGPASFGPRGQF